MANKPRPTCEWHSPIDGRPCPFIAIDFRAEKLGDRWLCLAHWPVFDARKSVEWLKKALEIARSSNQSLASFVFPQAAEAQVDTLNIGGLDLTQARFVGDWRLTCGGREATLAGAVFEKSVFLTDVRHELRLDGATIRGDVSIHGSHRGRINLRGAKCEGRVALVIGGPDPSVSFASVDCRGATFHEVPELRPNMLPQEASFSGAQFVEMASGKDSEARHRALRVAFAANSDREMEGFFYTWEKRCHRRSLKGWKLWFARSVSCLYDWTSNYGRSYELGFAWLVGLQVAFGLGYSAATHSWNLSPRLDSEIAAFTVAQLVRPFEAFSARAPTSAIYMSIFNGSEPSGAWLVWMTLHSILSLALVALTLLAIRWRFRRE